MAVFACFWPVFAIKNDHQHHRGIMWVNSHLHIFEFLHFLPFLVILGHFLHFWVSVGVGGVLGVLQSYKITRGINLVLQRVYGWV